MKTPTMEINVDGNSLVEKIAAMDMQAFDHLVLKYQQRIINLAFRLVGDRHAAEDIAQDVFLRAFKAAATFRGDSQVFTWLYRITVNLALNYRRKRRWENLFSFTIEDQKEQWTSADDLRPDVAAEKADERAIIRKALAKLPEAQRTMLILQRWEGLSYKEIAEITGLSLAAVEAKIHRANKRLAEILPALLEKTR